MLPSVPIVSSAVLPLVAAGLLAWDSVGATPIGQPPFHDVAVVCTDALEQFQAQADERARDYDRNRGITPEQLLALLDVAERTDYSLGQLLATGEHESAHTWNDFVRPPLSGGRVGSAAGVWQFQPKTFERIVHLYGEELLALTAADPASGRRRLDLGFGPFHDAQVRLIIRDTVDGLRDSEDEELLLLRHNFTVLAFAKYLLSKDAGARDPVEDYLFHFLGAGQGQRILTLARGDARQTRTVKPPPPPEPTTPEPQLAGASIAAQSDDNLRPSQRLRLGLDPNDYRAPMGGGQSQPARPAAYVALRRRAAPQPQSADVVHPAPPAPQPPQWPAPHGFAHDSPIVTGNVGMFYRDGAGRSDPYTWAEFLEHLSRRVKAAQQPRLVRAKYGVGFELNGGDMPKWSFDPKHPGKTTRLRLDDGRSVEMPKARLTAPMDAQETRDYQRRLAALISFGEAEPTAILSDAAAATLYRLGLLVGPADGAEPASQTWAGVVSALGIDMGLGLGTVLHTDREAVRDALTAFRKLVGKAPPVDATQTDLLLPAERVALEIYGARIERFVAAQEPST